MKPFVLPNASETKARSQYARILSLQGNGMTDLPLQLGVCEAKKDVVQWHLRHGSDR